jgi:hypothetical protein
MSENPERNNSEEAQNIENFRRQLELIQKNRSKFDGNVVGIKIESLGSAELAIWTRYKNLLDKVTNKDFVLNNGNVVEALEEAKSLELEIINVRSNDVAFAALMANRLPIITTDLTLMLEGATGDSGGATRDLRMDMCKDFVSEREEFFGVADETK